MKSNILLITALSMAAIPALGAGVASDFHKEQNPIHKKTAKTITLNGQTYKIGNVYADTDNPSWGSGGETVIRDPKGTTKLYTKEAAGTAVFANQLNLYEEDNFPAEIVWGENNEVYVKDIISTMPMDTYVKGEINGDMITFEAGQLVEYVSPEEYDGVHGYGIGVGVARSEIEGEIINFEYDPSISEYSLKMEKDGTLSLVLPGEPFDGQNVPEYMLCLFYTDDFQFIGFSDFYQIYHPEEYQLVTMPEGVTPEPYVFIDEYDFADFAYVAYTDDYLYIQGLNPMMPQSVVRAKIDGNKATIAQNEYMGVYLDLMFIFTKILIDNPDYDAGNSRSEPFIYAPSDMGFTLTLDRENGKIYADTPGVYLIFQPDEDTYENGLCQLGQFTLTYQSTLAGTPANPSHLRFYTDLVYYYGFANFQFNLSNYAKEGTLLDTSCLYYQVIVNDEPIIFGEQLVTNLLGFEDIAYEHVPGMQRWLPFDFFNGHDIDRVLGNIFDIGIYVADVKTIGVQSLYVYDDKYTYSDIVTLDVATGEITTSTTGINTVTDSPVVGEEYYTLGGLKVDKPGKGVFIKRMKHADGKVSVSKVVY